MKSEDVEGAAHRPDRAIREAFCSDFLQGLVEQREILLEFVRASILMESSRERWWAHRPFPDRGAAWLRAARRTGAMVRRMLADDGLGPGFPPAAGDDLLESFRGRRKLHREGEPFGECGEVPVKDEHRIHAASPGVSPR